MRFLHENFYLYVSSHCCCRMEARHYTPETDDNIFCCNSILFLIENNRCRILKCDILIYRLGFFSFRDAKLKQSSLTFLCGVIYLVIYYLDQLIALWGIPNRYVANREIAECLLVDKRCNDNTHNGIEETFSCFVFTHLIFINRQF